MLLSPGCDVMYWRIEVQYNRNYKNWNERKAMFTERQKEIKEERTATLINESKELLEENIWDRIKKVQ